MSDTTRHDAISPTEAARRLGITPDSVRARLRRGTLKGERVAGEWVVYLSPAVADAPSDPTRADSTNQRDTDTTHRATRHDADAMVRETSAAIIAAKDETITALRDEVAFLRDQLDQARRDQSAERERFDVIHREALSRIEALTTGALDSDENDHDAPYDAPAARSEEFSPHATDTTLNESDDQRSHFARLLSRLKGRG